MERIQFVQETLREIQTKYYSVFEIVNKSIRFRRMSQRESCDA